MSQPKPAGARFVGFLFAIVIELPVAIWVGMQKPLWQEPPLVIALWVGGFALVFFVIVKIAGRSYSLEDFLATGRSRIYPKYPKKPRAKATPRTRARD